MDDCIYFLFELERHKLDCEIKKTKIKNIDKIYIWYLSTIFTLTSTLAGVVCACSGAKLNCCDYIMTSISAVLLITSLFLTVFILIYNVKPIKELDKINTPNSLERIKNAIDIYKNLSDELSSIYKHKKMFCIFVLFEVIASATSVIATIIINFI